MIALTLLGLFPGCDDSIDVRRTREGIVFDGAITRSTAKKFESLARHDDQLFITSTGGSTPDAIDMAEEIREKRIDVFVPKYCASACAQYVFLAGQEKTLASSAHLLFHHSVLTWSDALKARPEVFTVENTDTIAKDVSRTRALYDSLNIDVNLMLCTDRMLGVRPDLVVRKRDGNAAGALTFPMDFDAAKPSLRLLRSFGVSHIHISESQFATSPDLAIKVVDISETSCDL